MFLWYLVMDLARAPRRTARKKGSGYENAVSLQKSTVKEAGTSISYVNKQGEINTTMKCTLYFVSNVHFICENIG
jgi:hypothetical protein